MRRYPVHLLDLPIKKDCTITPNSTSEGDYNQFFHHHISNTPVLVNFFNSMFFFSGGDIAKPVASGRTKGEMSTIVAGLLYTTTGPRIRHAVPTSATRNPARDFRGNNKIWSIWSDYAKIRVGYTVMLKLEWSTPLC